MKHTTYLVNWYSTIRIREPSSPTKRYILNYWRIEVTTPHSSGSVVEVPLNTAGARTSNSFFCLVNYARRKNRRLHHPRSNPADITHTLLPRTPTPPRSSVASATYPPLPLWSRSWRQPEVSDYPVNNSIVHYLRSIATKSAGGGQNSAALRPWEGHAFVGDNSDTTAVTTPATIAVTPNITMNMGR